MNSISSGNSPEGYVIRRATSEDIGTIVEHRRSMMREIRQCEESALDEMGAAFHAWLTPRLASGEYLGWLAIAQDSAIAKDGSIVAGTGLWMLDDWFPSLLPSGALVKERAYLLNVYTAPEHRMHGLSRMLVTQSIEWCRAKGITMASLHASKFGRPLYESLGFLTTNEMRMILE